MKTESDKQKIFGTVYTIERKLVNKIKRETNVDLFHIRSEMRNDKSIEEETISNGPQ